MSPNEEQTYKDSGSNPLSPTDMSEESPDLLRWRADILLDEMMLGGVDISARRPSSIESTPNRPQNAYTQANHTQSAQTHNPLPPVNNGGVPNYQQPFTINQQPSPEPQQRDRYAQQPIQPTEGQPTYNQYTLPQPNLPGVYQQPIPQPVSDVQHLHPQQQQPQDGHLGVQPPLYDSTNPRVSPSSGSAPPYSPAYRPPPKERSPWNVVTGHSNEYLSSVPRHETVRTNYSGYYPDGNYLGSGASDVHAPNNQYNSSRQSSYVPQLGPVVQGRSSASFANPMDVGARARRRPDLLPRQSQLDMQALQQEMVALQEKVDTALPIGRDLTERAIHLLDKGNNILQHFPERSAEVSYYVQQVRSILQRAEQRVFWSNIYRRRLSLYLVAWLLLSVVIILSCVLYPQLLASSAAFLMGTTTSSWFGQHVTAFLLTIGAGALGSSLGTLINMWRYGQSDHGFFDHKYGLLGITLPIISVIVSALGYLIFGIVTLILGINPASLFLIALIPAVMAFLFGFSQERLYGTVN